MTWVRGLSALAHRAARHGVLLACLAPGSRFPPAHPLWVGMDGSKGKGKKRGKKQGGERVHVVAATNSGGAAGALTELGAGLDRIRIRKISRERIGSC